ncbi:hypothetical protein LT85_1038 [Collimonas arenae]|uniref:Transmembrane protein n=1 Tax=Collimonas arenae TaxID=279058 RepID=A0A0A1F6R3_9BURK|nr:hypothetical protein [Collimonas arenae]AIY40196.1 hypothetical protein LT85_1038 [Collimonas arenae]
MEHLKHTLDAFLGFATLANFVKLILVGFSVLPTVMTVISTGLAIIWYVMQIRKHLRNKKEMSDD